MIYFERGDRRLGFVTLRDSCDGNHGSAEAELYLGRMAIELREHQTALEVVQRFRQGQVPCGGWPSGTEEYWPAGKDMRSLQTVIEYLEGYRLCQSREKASNGIELLLHANRLIPDNVAINFALGRAYQSSAKPLAAAPYYRVVSEKGGGGLKLWADRWLARNKKMLDSETQTSRSQPHG